MMRTVRRAFIEMCVVLALWTGWPGSEVSWNVAAEAGEGRALGFDIRAGFQVIETIPQLRQSMVASGKRVRMKPGVYRVRDMMPDGKTLFAVTGSDSYFDLRGVTLQVDTHLLAQMRGKTHEPCVYRVLGSNHTFEGAIFEDIGDEPPHLGLSEFGVWGDRNTFRDCTFIIRGSAPYGYGDLFGKGKNHMISLQKHAAMSINGDDTKVVGCRYSIHTFGHAIHLHGAQRTLIQGVSIEGVLRLSDEILAERTGPAARLGYRDLFGRPIEKGKMICLAEDGIRAYSEGERNGRTRHTSGITVLDSTVRRMRGGITLALATGEVVVRGCTVLESGYPGHAYSLPSNAVVRDCRGDAAYAPLLMLGYPNRHGADVELELLDSARYVGNDRLAIINGTGHKVQIHKPDGKPLTEGLKILCGETYRVDGKDLDKPFARRITLINDTLQPVILTALSSQCDVRSQGRVSDEGTENKVANKGDF